MGLNIGIVQTLENNKVLLKEQSGTKKKPIERLYIADKEDADKFIKERQKIANANKFQKVLTGVLSAGIALIVGATVKFGAFGKTVSGLACGLISYFGSKAVDKKMDENFNKNAMKNYNIEDVTDKKTEDIK